MAATNLNFSDFVKETREKKKDEALAQAILGSKKGRKSGPGAIANSRNASPKPTLLSRMSSANGVSKQRSSSAKPDINGKWTHDLHQPEVKTKRITRTTSASQIERNTRNFDKFRSQVQKNAQINEAPAQSAGFSIRGVAASGPFTVIASNFAPGTTAADIEAVMTPIGGELQGCRLLSSNPTVMVEMIFEAKDGAENVIATFNGKKADGRVLYVYMKDPVPAAPVAPPTGPRNRSYDRPANTRAVQSPNNDEMMEVDTNGRQPSVQDGRFGFSETGQARRFSPPRGPRRRY
ncbi:hypothetical protein P154DRAFT_522780 [Amniculicola lignicola CBS 123094]|uniref:RRM domain-containing protein n=1 Tax=Amniculicola lignicola CBS 123094 TaxID=1392246 RepID=A0A6A5WGD8_9PLEO|nr:hypothetical protein P154DRAFT_522780 [Amniculicola lignicola CBS 123094]